MRIVLDWIYDGGNKTAIIFTQQLNEYCKARYQHNMAKAVNVFHRCLMVMKRNDLKGAKCESFFEEKGTVGGIAWIVSAATHIPMKIVEKRVRSTQDINKILSK